MVLCLAHKNGRLFLPIYVPVESHVTFGSSGREFNIFFASRGLNLIY